MYVPRRYEVTDPQAIDEFVRAHGFATLITSRDGLPNGTHVPIELLRSPAGRILEGHVARANPHWQAIADGDRALAVFLGPHAYVSPSWYDHENVPTWNYQAVHMSGPIELVQDAAELLVMVRGLSLHYEPDGVAGGGFDVDAMTTKLRDAELRGIVGFRIHVDRVEAAFKLSQNRDATNRARVRAKLRERGDPDSLAVANAMERLEAPSA
jgi:transcriptional regulator